MPWKDPELKREYDREYCKSKCKFYTIKVKADSEIPPALERMAQSTGTSSHAYMVEAITEKLRRDGYLQD